MNKPLTDRGTSSKDAIFKLENKGNESQLKKEIEKEDDLNKIKSFQKEESKEKDSKNLKKGEINFT
mgnify:CR=1 FL=1